MTASYLPASSHTAAITTATVAPCSENITLDGPFSSEFLWRLGFRTRTPGICLEEITSGLPYGSVGIPRALSTLPQARLLWFFIIDDRIMYGASLVGVKLHGGAVGPYGCHVGTCRNVHSRMTSWWTSLFGGIKDHGRGKLKSSVMGRGIRGENPSVRGGRSSMTPSVVNGYIARICV